MVIGQQSQQLTETKLISTAFNTGAVSCITVVSLAAFNTGAVSCITVVSLVLLYMFSFVFPLSMTV